MRAGSPGGNVVGKGALIAAIVAHQELLSIEIIVPPHMLKILSTMPAHVRLEKPLEQELLSQLGDRLAWVRKQRGLSAAALAAEVGISRNTLKAAESGDASVAMGTYVRVLSALGLVADLALVAAAGSRSHVSGDAAAARHVRLESEVAQGRRDARSLVSIPRELARSARLTFQKDSFGKPQPW